LSLSAAGVSDARMALLTARLIRPIRERLSYPSPSWTMAMN
jgi:hypothetical protein